MKKSYKDNHVEITFHMDPFTETLYNGQGNKKTCKIVTINATDDYEGCDRDLMLDEDNIGDILKFLTGSQTKRKPSPFVTKQELMDSYGSFMPNKNEFSKTNFNSLYGMFTIEDGGDSAYITKKGDGIELGFETSERSGYKETILLSKTEKNDLINELKNIQW